MLYVEENYHWFDEPFSGVAGFRRVGSQPAKQPERTGLEHHLSLEACSHATERKTLLDMSKEEYARRLEEGSGAIPTLPCDDALSSSVDILPKVKGWALKESKRGLRFSEKQKAYLTSKFKIGITSGSQKMRKRMIFIHRYRE